VHVIWGISKDFGANGLRLGAIISQNNPGLHQALVPPSLYTSSSSISDHVVANILEDDAWIDEYIAQNRKKLAESYEHVVQWARNHGIEYAPGVNAAFFLWVNLGKAYCKTHASGLDSENIDQTVNGLLIKHKVFLASGIQFGSEEPGWFRIVFTQRRDHLDEGLRRIVTAILA
jgi:aspartate/methionine/tyrosine aminotransferase